MRFAMSLLAICVSLPVDGQEFPRPKPTEAHQVFAADAGTWDCQIKLYPKGPQGPAMKFAGVEINSLVCGDEFLQSTFTEKIGDREIESRSLIGYDPRTKEYRGTWVDSFTTIPTVLTGTYDRDTQDADRGELGRGPDRKGRQTETGNHVGRRID